ncbi:hypothetical protein GGX14DRAFT_406352 [Mycena pura]|uniref:Uncharacterized protein n=1 Tax=Mycena pura TaxID=153505 RepID=A0AAD6UUH0_9AGAR|nr:hypothetical protein GGX14DRAFT_406352 [Mycena pura]
MRPPARACFVILIWDSSYKAAHVVEVDDLQGLELLLLLVRRVWVAFVVQCLDRVNDREEKVTRRGPGETSIDISNSMMRSNSNGVPFINEGDFTPLRDFFGKEQGSFISRNVERAKEKVYDGLSNLRSDSAVDMGLQHRYPRICTGSEYVESFESLTFIELNPSLQFLELAR